MAVQSLGQEFNREDFLHSTKQHSFIILATNYYTKWVEVIPMRAVSLTNIIQMIKKNIMHRFGLPQHIVIDQRTVFAGSEVK